MDGHWAAESWTAANAFSRLATRLTICNRQNNSLCI